jgi:tRNA threonylcarbamoyl adenosine modification protein YjeE
MPAAPRPDGSRMEPLTRELPHEASTSLLGQDIAMALRPGDAVALSGDLGAGKSTLARAVLRALAADPALEVPSPTYTLCQRYELVFPVSHFDFYRLSGPGDLEELGFDEAIETGAVLAEWPQRAGDRLPSATLHVELSTTASGGRTAVITGGGEGVASLRARLERSFLAREFLDTQWKAGAERRFLQGDASSRRYETAHVAGETRILMDAPRRPDGPPIADGKPYSRIAHLAEDVVPFIAVGQTLRNAGFAAPLIHAASVNDGLLLIEHLGSERIVDSGNRPVAPRYVEAARLLALFHSRDWPREMTVATPAGPLVHAVPHYDRGALMIEASLLADWYAPRESGRALTSGERGEFDAIWQELIESISGSMPTLVMRDYHSPNLIWREDETFPRNLGLIDFQDAVIGPQAYDVASLGQDARVDVPRDLEAAMLDEYISLRRAQGGFDEAIFLRDYAVLAAHRATKILGIFVRLDQRDGKPGYLRHLPRMRGYLARNLEHPALARYKAWCLAVTGLGSP